MVDPLVRKEQFKYTDSIYGNASSYHLFGRNSLKVIEKSRLIIAEKINLSSDDIFFTSGGTESNNLLLKGMAFREKHFNNSKKNQIIISTIEHSSIYNTVLWLEKEGFQIKYARVNKNGLLDLGHLAHLISERTLLVSIIHAHNETGVIQNLKKIGSICRERGVLFHTDACQSFTKIPLDITNYKIDAATLNSHKIHGPTGVGALVLTEKLRTNKLLAPLFHGGNQEFGQRSGTYNTSGIAAFAKAVEISDFSTNQKINKLKLLLANKITSKHSDTIINTPSKNSLPNILNISFINFNSLDIFRALSKLGIAVSTGSACASGNPEPSRSLLNMGMSSKHASAAIRFSLSKWTNAKDIKRVVQAIDKVIASCKRTT